MDHFPTRQHLWRPTIKRCLMEQWTRIDALLRELPAQEHLEYDKLTPYQQHCVQAIDAIEQEWLVDPDQRAEMSCLVFD